MKGEWRTGREDIDAYTGEPFASIYCDGVPGVLARVFGPDRKEVARVMAASRDLLAALRALSRQAKLMHPAVSSLMVPLLDDAEEAIAKAEHQA